jgi:uncharacterized protein (DUF1015 family)
VPRFEPFPGIRYDFTSRDPGTVTAPPYDVISPSDREALVSGDPDNVVRIDLPVGEGDGVDPYERAGALWTRWRADGVLRDDPAPSFTIYRMESVDDDGRARRTTGVVGALELSRPGEGGILPHEFTTPKAKSDRLDLLRATSANLSAVWGLSPAPGLTDLLATDDEPEVHFTDADGVTHSAWTLTDPDRLSAIAAAVGAHPVVIADGHHRYETSLAYLGERREAAAAGGAPVGDAAAVMCFVVELADDELTVGPIHRLVSGLPDGFDLLGALAPFFELEPFELTGTGTVGRLQQAGGLAVVLPDGCWVARPRPDAMAGARDLDSSRLDVALAALPSPTVVYQHGVDHVRAAVAAGEAQAGVLLRPATVDQIVEIAHGGERMPPKTTFFAPKPRTGIVFRDLT